jgi:hypothetical protein
VFKFDPKEDTCIYPFYQSTYNFKRQVNLLLIGDEVKWHYIYIKSLKTLLMKKTKHYGKSAFICTKCYKQTNDEKIFSEHVLICTSEKRVIEEMPEDTTLKFRNFKNRQRNAITIYAGVNVI